MSLWWKMGCIIMKNKKAIVVYVDNSPRIIEEFSWLYKSWYINNLYNEYDILVYSTKETFERLSLSFNLIKHREMKPYYETDKFWENYKFVNSFSMFNNKEEVDFITNEYDFVLKTDCDVFLTKNLLGLEPEKIHIGFGGYMVYNSPEVVENLLKVKTDLNLNYSDLNHIGASIYGKSNIVCNIVNLHLKLTEIILKKYFRNNQGNWPGWYIGVSSMYGIHLAVNHYVKSRNIKLNSLDELCDDSLITNNTYHIHAWHYDGYFSKHRWFEGKYNKLIIDKYPIKMNEYCHWIASNELEELLKIKK